MRARRMPPHLTVRIALVFVLGAALTVGTWSVFTLTTQRFGMPWPVAVVGAGMLDGSAMFFARLSQTYATSPDSGLIPRLAMLGTVTTSAWVNWQHALLAHWGTVGCVILAAAPCLAEITFELYHRFVHREALRAQGRVPGALPVLGRWAWTMHPVRSMRVINTVVLGRLDAVAASLPHDAPRPAADDAAPDDADDAPHAAPALPASPAEAQHVMLPEYVLRALTAPHLAALPPVASDAGSGTAGQSHDAPLVRADAPQDDAAGEAPQPLPAAPVRRITAAAAPDAHPASRLTGDAPAASDLMLLSKAAAVRVMREAHPAASSEELAQRLTGAGVDATAGYVRTVLSRERKTGPAQTGGYL